MSTTPSSGTAGFSLVEILIVVAVGACLLASGWSWVWAVTSAGACAGDRAEARTSLAYARRVLLADLRCASGLAAGRTSTNTTVALAVPSWRRSDGLVTVSWDESRGILWRLTSGCHLAEGVEAFGVTYLDAGGSELGCGAQGLGAAAIAAARGVVIDVRIRVDRAAVRGHWVAWFGWAGE